VQINLRQLPSDCSAPFAINLPEFVLVEGARYLDSRAVSAAVSSVISSNERRTCSICCR